MKYITFRDLIWKARQILSIYASAIQLSSNYNVHIVNTFQFSSMFCMNTATPILVKPVVAKCCSIFPVSFLLPQCLDRGWRACLIFKQNIYDVILLLWSHWSFAIYFNGNMIKLWCVHLRSHWLQWFLSRELITLLKQAKYAFMLYVLSKCCCAFVAVMLWLNCLCDAKNSKQLSVILLY